MSAHAGRCTIATAIRLLIVALITVASSTSSIAQQIVYFAPTGSMSIARQSAATALLDDGRVLIVGHDGSWPAELYDPASGQFVPTGAPNEPRSDAAAVRLSDGRVLVVGGWNAAGAVATAELYDPVSGAFTPAGSMVVARARPAAARLPDGRVLIAGGYGGAPHSSVELYDPATGEFVATGSMASARLGTATLLPDGTVLVVAGNSAEVYDPVLGGFRAAGDLNFARRGHAATLLADGRVLVTGGVDHEQKPIADAEVFDRAAGVFRLAGRMLNARADHAAVPLPDGAVLALGGRDAVGVLSSTEVYDPTHATFTAAAALTEPRSAPIATTLPDGGILVAGGRGTNSEALATAERYRRGDQREETSTVLTSSMSASTYGQPVSYLARVRSDSEDPSGVVQFFDGNMVLGEAPLDDDGRALLTISNTPAGTQYITAVYPGSAEFKPSASPAFQQTVARAAATSSLTLTPIQRQYSDRVTFTATVLPPNAAQSVTFKMGTVVLGTAPVVAGNALLDMALSTNTPPGSRIITAVFNQDVPNYTISNVSRSISIVREDARVTLHSYGATVYTACQTCNTATVLLRATVQDISATAEANGDVSPGDIRNATLTFVNRATYAPIATVPVRLIDPNNMTIGEAVYEWNVDLGGASSRSFKVGYVVGNYYTRSTYEYVTVTVSKPK